MHTKHSTYLFIHYVEGVHKLDIVHITILYIIYNLYY